MVKTNIAMLPNGNDNVRKYKINADKLMSKTKVKDGS
jgi:hypothetical protein